MVLDIFQVFEPGHLIHLDSQQLKLAEGKWEEGEEIGEKKSNSIKTFLKNEKKLADEHR